LPVVDLKGNQLVAERLGGKLGSGYWVVHRPVSLRAVPSDCRGRCGGFTVPGGRGDGCRSLGI
jgi:hypothetical protein